MKIEIDKNWCINAAKREGDAEIGACSPEIADRAKAMARERGHRDIYAEITTATGAKKPVWQFYIGDAALGPMLPDGFKHSSR